MKKIKEIKREHLWLTMMVLGPLTAYAAVFYPPLSVLAAAFLLIGLKGVLCDIM